MNEVLDQIATEGSIKSGNLKISKNLAKTSGILFGIWLATSLLRVWINMKYSVALIYNVDVLDWIIVLLLLVFFVLSPVGLFFSLKSWWRNEGKIGWRIGLLLFHLFSCVILAFIVYVAVRDVVPLFD